MHFILKSFTVLFLFSGPITASPELPIPQAQFEELTCLLFGGEFCKNHTIGPRSTDLPFNLEQPSNVQPNVVHVVVYMEAQCGDSTRFMRRQLWPTYEKFLPTGRLDVSIIAFGKASCQPEAGDYECRCQHGQRECDLNQLMNCVQDFYNNDATKYMAVLSCIQGKTDLDYAKDYCIANNPELPLEDIMKCTTGRRGRLLLALAGQRTASLQPPLANVPLIYVENEKSLDAFYEFEETICHKMNPRPEQCPPAH